MGDTQCPLCRAKSPKIYLTLYPICIDETTLNFEDTLRTQPPCPSDIVQRLRDDLLIARSDDNSSESLDLYKEKEKLRYKYDKELDFFYDREGILKSVDLLRLPLCPKKRCWWQGKQSPFFSIDALKNHLMHEHSVSYCDICLQHSSAFLAEQRVYTPAELELHKEGRSSFDDKAFRGHLRCHFCRSYLYDTDTFASHMHERHFLCEFCHSADIPNRYFAAPHFLYKHFEKDHYVCKHPDCMQQEMMLRAFGSSIDLHAHMTQFHGVKPSRQNQLQADSFGFRFGFSSDHQNKVAIKHGLTPGLQRMTIEEAKRNLVIFDFGTYQKEVLLWRAPQSTRSPPSESDSMTSHKFVSNLNSVSEGLGDSSSKNSLLKNGKGDSKELQESSRLIERLLKKDGRFEEYRQICSKYIRGEMKSKEFYDSSKKIFGTNTAIAFPSIISSIPDDMRREAIRTLHSTDHSFEWGKGSSILPLEDHEARERSVMSCCYKDVAVDGTKSHRSGFPQSQSTVVHSTAETPAVWNSCAFI